KRVGTGLARRAWSSTCGRNEAKGGDNPSGDGAVVTFHNSHGSLWLNRPGEGIPPPSKVGRESPSNGDGMARTLTNVAGPRRGRISHDDWPTGVRHRHAPGELPPSRLSQGANGGYPLPGGPLPPCHTSLPRMALV